MKKKEWGAPTEFFPPVDGLLEDSDKSLLIFSCLGVASAIYWSFYVFFPNDAFIQKVGLALNAVWLIGYILVIMTVLFGGIHVWHRTRG